MVIDIVQVSNVGANVMKQSREIISGFVIIAESHITIHTYPLRQLAKIDIVSCKQFGQKKAISILKKTFNAGEAETQFLYRGKHYPRDVKKAAALVKKERVLKSGTGC